MIIIPLVLCSCRARGHDRGDLQQDEEADLGPTGTHDLGSVEGAPMT